MTIRLIGTVTFLDHESGVGEVSRVNQVPLEIEGNVPTGAGRVALPQWTRSFGRELRTEVIVAAIRHERHVAATASIKFFEGASRRTDDLEASDQLQLHALTMFGGLGRTRLLNNRETDGGDWTDVAVILLADVEPPTDPHRRSGIPYPVELRASGRVLMNEGRHSEFETTFGATVPTAYGSPGSFNAVRVHPYSGSRLLISGRCELARSGWVACVVDLLLRSDRDPDHRLVGVGTMLYLVPVGRRVWRVRRKALISGVGDDLHAEVDLELSTKPRRLP